MRHSLKELETVDEWKNAALRIGYMNMLNNLKRSPSFWRLIGGDERMKKIFSEMVEKLRETPIASPR